MYLDHTARTAFFVREKGDMDEFKGMPRLTDLVWKYTVSVDDGELKFCGMYHPATIYYDEKNDWYTMFMYLDRTYSKIVEVERFHDFDTFTRLGYKVQSVKSAKAFSRLFCKDN